MKRILLVILLITVMLSCENSRELTIPNKDLSGLYHVSSDAISKYDLLNIMKKIYQKDIKINAFDDFVLDRSMNSDRFKYATGYKSPSWKKLVEDMYQHVISDDCYKNKFFRK